VKGRAQTPDTAIDLVKSRVGMSLIQIKAPPRHPCC